MEQLGAKSKKDASLKKQIIIQSLCGCGLLRYGQFPQVRFNHKKTADVGYTSAVALCSLIPQNKPISSGS